jgi:hypothetical protein
MLGRAEELRAEALASARSSRSRRSVERSSVSRLFRRGNPLEDPWREPQDLMVPEMAFGDARYALLLRDVGSALNLNEASEEMLRLFFSQGLGVDYAEADDLAQAILDWRDEDEIPRLNGGEREQYLDDEALVLPPNRDFVEIDELRHIRGMTPGLYVNPAGATALIQLRDSGYLPRSDRDLYRLLPGAMGAIFEQLCNDTATTEIYTTDQVEILAQGWVDGGVVQVTSRVVVSRGNTGAEVVWREVF